MKPVIFLNFKSYPQTVGKAGLELAKDAVELAERHGVELYVAPHLVDTSMMSYAGLPVFAQHCDPIVGNGGTGRVTLDSLAKLGVKGVLINHSEYPQTLEEILFLASKSREFGLKSCVCIPDEKILEDLRRVEPDFLAVEPPELIGGNVSVSVAKPGLLRRVFGYVYENMRSTRPICGAGIKTLEDVRAAKRLGAEGILVASGFVLSSNPKKSLEELIAGFG